ncbi:MAG: hypothetical protein UR39_C0002G0091 [Candidatus Woesebacteria bacterium GW2011_GWA1_33_30]|uniref:Uncharacterized protein n=1 Tax=Candidatus Woesebacteria bacterium GW2011_GWA2_33_28 TaxID=1618561 RepID=A0A0F9ZUE2_9BACT|nr:MAG: hypothetical protein UR38_C0002G0091 [Candidatus Woesebacteria bacterium GW2011_GWA2_33_28]KKP48801.1 MAG: hypothetical protein UR39_C0002G0091 [Candidatus Woesebacteria bacterium GW2011_GWA1_33_30]KKP50074.1 MAG: hypothetical protein UR40_C0002G0091 [Microgenomates group bacterium GW2011_GWC1_33_32]KKP51845.1 MAG: hypothetical protein UR44_C0006G0091 [Candidatus Woesebacteria bacterium GW2011_GWB1_33_38]KKP57696.1 MAG: hypothetical protein UR48_C0012G0024 [Microgenomates group bacteriu
MGMATKYKDYFDRMISTDKYKFDEFNKLYNEYIKNQDGLQEKYNAEGKEILKIIREWENKLCSQTEKAGFGNYSTNLSEKFWTEVRKTYPLIDYIGVVTKKESMFLIKKIKL